MHDKVDRATPAAGRWVTDGNFRHYSFFWARATDILCPCCRPRQDSPRLSFRHCS